MTPLPCVSRPVTTFDIESCTSRPNAVINPTSTYSFTNSIISIPLATLNPAVTYGVSFDAWRTGLGTGGGLCNISATIDGQNLTTVTTNYYLYMQMSHYPAFPRAPGVKFQPSKSNVTLQLSMVCYSTWQVQYVASNIAVIPVCDDSVGVVKTTVSPYDCTNLVGNGDFSHVDFSSPNPFIGWVSQETPVDLTDLTSLGGYTGNNNGSETVAA
ncbi:hypothetical protein ANO11243_062220 [Dothideomycetidae sp. 11243]|nr:hypothetical protein ANO11243_062220 [fungal sp. No.11243]